MSGCMSQSEDTNDGCTSCNRGPDGVFDEARRNPVREAMEQILTDRGLLAVGEDAIEKTKAIADALDDLAGFLGVHEPYARCSVDVLWGAADELRGHAWQAEHGDPLDGDAPDLVFEGLTFRPRDADEGDGS